MRANQTDLLEQTIAIFQELQNHRDRLQAELDEIERALGQVGNVSPLTIATPATPAVSSGARVVRRGRPPRNSNALPLREAVVQVLTTGAKTKEELLAGVKQVGYKFATSDPANSLQAFLYGAGKKLIEKAEGKKFALIAGGAAAAPVKAKRNISPAARKRMADAARKMWADRKKAAKKNK